MVLCWLTTRLSKLNMTYAKENMTQRNPTIYCDLDGVLVDFDRYKKENLSVKAQTDSNQMWAEMALRRKPYRMMKPTPYARQLWDAIVDTNLPACVLTAIPRPDTIPTAEADKTYWVRVKEASTVFGDDPPEVKIGPYSKDKYKHCQPGDVLIDDNLKNCEQWAAAGGTAIHHTGNVNATIRSLRNVVGH